MAKLSTTMSGGKTMKVQTFTSSGTWTRPEGVDAVEIFLVGGGGGGGGCDGSSYTRAVGGGGGGGRVIDGKVVDVTGTAVGQTIAVTIGAGGAGGNGTVGANGSSSSFGSVTAVGGGGGGNGVSSYIDASGADGASGGGSGIATSSDCIGGGGGGAGGDAQEVVLDVDSPYGRTNRMKYIGRGNYGGNGVVAPSTLSNLAVIGPPSGGSGIKGYGGGAGGSLTNGIYVKVGIGKDGGATGVYLGTTGTANGNNAIDNHGGGGSGGVVYNTSYATATGGNGGSGICVVTWYE